MGADWRNPERVVPWKPRQRFRVTDRGRRAIDEYRQAVVAAQASPSQRSELEAAKRGWADGRGLRPADGILLEDLGDGQDCLAELGDTLEACGITLREARGGLDRLLAGGWIETVVRPGE